jgi:tetratricopeptide (TPR) repeat protein
MKRFATLILAFLAAFPLVARGVEVTVKTAVALRDSSHAKKVIGEVPAGAAFDALAVTPNWVLGTYTHNGVVLRGFIPEDAILDQEKLADLRERYRRTVALSATTIDQMLALPDEKIDIGLGALLVGKQYDPSLDIPKYLARLDAMAQEIRARPEWQGEETNPRKLIEILNDYIFTEAGYVVLTEDECKTEHSFLHVLLDSKKGGCASLSTLYLALAERLNLPLFGVCAPGHAFVRYESGATKINVEPTAKGARHWDITYSIGLGVPGTDAARSFYMRSLTKRQFLGLLLSNLGAACGTEGRFDEEVEACRKALSINPNDAEAWSNLGVAHHSQGKFDGAVEAHRKALSINPNLAEAWNNLGAAYHSQGNFDDAVEACRKALSINPNYAGAWSNLGNAYHSQGKFDEAVEAHRKALSINPNLAEAWSNLGNAYHSQGKFDEAVEACRKALSINPNLADAWTNLGLGYGGLGKFDEAVEAHRKALSINPNLADAWTNLGAAYGTQGKFDRAVEAYSKALSVNPNLAEAWYGLGAAYHSQGKFDEAVEACRKALSINPNLADAWNNLAVAHYSRGDYASAWECVRKCQKAGGAVNSDFLRLLRGRMREPGT